MKLGRKGGAGSLGEGGGTRPESHAREPAPDAGEAVARSKPLKAVKRGFLDGQMLIAMPSMGDERFARSVIYMCAHSADGAMGIIGNQPAAHISFSDLLVQLEVVPAADLLQRP